MDKCTVNFKLIELAEAQLVCYTPLLQNIHSELIVKYGEDTCLIIVSYNGKVMPTIILLMLYDFR